ncbi:hypothetical protein FHR94_000446 [Halomonas cerina]|uniref:Uncharacterized protein n=1 Tax=Halomonas cerina TaxID=447424 RepID=A0A839V940_9GAMM|nr:hypothetical protein [Halomonas cerina]
MILRAVVRYVLVSGYEVGADRTVGVASVES